jgi:hypothetical protein
MFLGLWKAISRKKYCIIAIRESERCHRTKLATGSNMGCVGNLQCDRLDDPNVDSHVAYKKPVDPAPSAPDCNCSGGMLARTSFGWRYPGSLALLLRGGMAVSLR